ncbi:MAG: hypothetical protein H6716_23465 [Polyangiaceae bacterium]|nr:hypothetical protein [Polyangiaceae bacterium]
MATAGGLEHRFDAGTDVADISVAGVGRDLRIAVATPTAAVVFDAAHGTDALRHESTLRLCGHDGRVTGVFLSEPKDSRDPHRTLLVSTDERGNLHRWRADGTHADCTRIHRKAVGHVRCARPTKGAPFLVTGSDDRDVVVYDLGAGQVRARLSAHAGWTEHLVPIVSALEFEFLVVTDRVGAVVWDVPGERVVERVRGRATCAPVGLHIEGKTPALVFATADSLVLWRDGRVERFAPPVGEEIRGVALAVPGSDAPVLRIAAGDGVYVREQDGHLVRTTTLRAPVLRWLPWQDGSGAVVALLDGSLWSLEWTP